VRELPLNQSPPNEFSGAAKAMKHTSSSDIPRHRKDAVSWSSEPEARERMLRAPFCGFCRKLLLATEPDARSYIGLLLHTEPRRIDGYTLKPYRCPRKTGWHVGRNHRTAELLRKGKR
jgi:hypothetical protein